MAEKHHNLDSFVEKSIEVDVPVRTVYNQWTQFEEFPMFMEGVEEVKQLDDTRTHWKAKIAGKEKEWDATIITQEPDTKLSWQSTTGADNSGTVLFDKLGENRTQVTLALGYEPEGFIEKAGDMLGFVERRVEGDLKRFKKFIEERGHETGGWRGEVQGGKERSA
jgi:uncharacterized membrane protein